MKYAIALLLIMSFLSVEGQNGAADFNGMGEIGVTNAGAMIAGSPEFTIETWVYLRNQSPTFPNFDGIVGWRNEIDHDFYLLQLSATSIEARLRTSAGVYSVTDTGIRVNSWNHLALSYDGSTIQLYINGRTAGRAAASGSFTDTTEILYLGKLPFQVNNFSLDGTLDEVRIWRKARSASEINSLRFVEIINSSSYTDLAGHFKLNDLAGSSIAYEEIMGRHGKVAMGVTFTNSTAPLFNGPTGFATKVICAGDSVLINGMWVKAAGNFRDTIVRPGMADSLVFLEVKVANKPLIPGIIKSNPDSLFCNIIASRYKWFGNGILLSDTSRKIHFTLSANYRVIAYNAQCPSDTSPAFFFQASAVLSEFDEVVKIYPSPADERIFVNSGTERIEEAVMMDLQGKEIIVVIPKKQQFIIETNSLPSGIYLLRLRVNEETIMQKILIQH